MLYECVYMSASETDTADIDFISLCDIMCNVYVHVGIHLNVCEFARIKHVYRCLFVQCNACLWTNSAKYTDLLT